MVAIDWKREPVQMTPQSDVHWSKLMPYKYQGFGAGPTTPRMWVEIIATLIILFVLYVAMAWWLLSWN